MAANYLGLFLLNKGVITEQQLLEGLEYQERTNQRIGGLAVEAGLMSSDDTDQIFDRQASDNRRFGEIAVAERMLSRHQLDDLLFRQRVNNVYLGEALLHLGYLDADSFSDLMDEYYTLERERSQKVSNILTSIEDYKVVLSMMEAAKKMFVRFVDRNVKLLPGGEFPQAGTNKQCVRFTSRIKGECVLAFSFLFCSTSVELLGNISLNEPAPSDAVCTENKFFQILEGYLRAALKDRDCVLESCNVEEVACEEWNTLQPSDMALNMVTPDGRQVAVLVSRPECSVCNG